MDSITFSDQEIEEELARLGYTNIPRDKLKEFQKDLNSLVQAEKSRGNSQECSFASCSDSHVAGGSEGKHNAGQEKKFGSLSGEVSSSHQLRREDLEQYDRREREVKFSKPTVPGHFALFELPTRTAPDHHDDVSDSGSEMRRMKRKTLRKNEEGSKYIDESMSDIDAASIIDTHERMQRVILRDHDPVGPERCTQSAHSRYGPPPYRLRPDDPRPPSVIYTSMEHPHTKNLQRADPVNRYHQMQHVWAMQLAPGEKKHKDLRWNIREQMLTQFVPEKKPLRKYIANNYVPPPMKRRDALRWQIRLDMAQGTMPLTAYNT